MNETIQKKFNNKVISLSKKNYKRKMRPVKNEPHSGPI